MHAHSSQCLYRGWGGVVDQLVEAARQALLQAPPVGDQAYLLFARALRSRLEQRWPEIQKANSEDLAQATAHGHADTVVERIRLTEAHLDVLTELTRGIERELPDVARPGPAVHGVGSLVARRVPKPLGVVLMIYEARATVTVEGALVSASAGNATIMRGGSEIAATNQVLGSVFADALADAALPEAMVQVVTDQDRSHLRQLLRRDDAIDVLIPRGSPSLLDFCRSASKIPLIFGGDGVNHLYVHRSADVELAVTLVLDGKLPDPAGCTALEMVLVDDVVAEPFITALAARMPTLPPSLVEGFGLRMPDALQARLPAEVTRVIPVATLAAHDDGREFLDRTLAVRPVSGLAEAVAHIRRFGTGHTECVVGEEPETITRFCQSVDAAALIVNGSPRLHDGPTIGLGQAELAISTGRLHVRGPVTLRDLLTYSWLIEGHGTVRFPTPAR
jgi:glutamate-5-semialdehyde dehydrogenase